MKICFELSMPNRASWNGRWSGEADLYARVRDFVRSRDEMELAKSILAKPNYSYDFGDGWRANVSVRAVTSPEARKIERRSRGFSGYDWMIDSIINHLEIKYSDPFAKASGEEV